MHRYEIVSNTGSYGTEHDYTWYYRKMHTEPFCTKIILDTHRTIDKHKGKEEDRKYDHMQQLRNEFPEYRSKLSHNFSHILGVTKLQNIFFSHKYPILVTKTPKTSHFHPIYHNLFIKQGIKDTFVKERWRQEETNWHNIYVSKEFYCLNLNQS